VTESPKTKGISKIRKETSEKTIVIEQCLGPKGRNVHEAAPENVRIELSAKTIKKA